MPITHSTPKRLAWHILGAGAIGALFTQSLSKHGCKIAWIARDAAHLAKWQKHGPTQWIGLNGDSEDLSAELDIATNTAPIPRVLVTTKACDAAKAVGSIAHRLDNNSTVLLMTNGMGVAEEVEKIVPQCALFCGTTTAGANRRGYHEVHHAGNGTTQIGQLDSAGNPPEWFDDFTQCSLQAQWQETMRDALLSKLAVNCAINPLTAIHRCRNGELLDIQIRPCLDALCIEISDILNSAGHTTLAASATGRILQVIENTATNRSSMLQDVLAHRPTEIDYINGYLLQLAERHQCAAPLNAELISRIKALT